MRKKITIITLVTSLILMNGVFTQEIFAEKKSDLEGIQSERKEIQEDLSVQEQKMNELYSEMQQLDKEVTHLNQQISDKQSEVEKIANQVDETINEIAKIQVEIEKLEESIEERFEILKTRAASYQKSGGAVRYIEVLFGSKSFGDFVSRLTAVNQIVDSDTALMDELERDMEKVEEHKLMTMEKLDELNEMHHEQEAQLAVIEEEKLQQEEAKNALNSKQKELVAYVEKLESEDIELQNMEDKVKAEIAAAAKRAEEEERRAAVAKAKKEAELTAKKKQEEAAQQETELVHVSKKAEKNNSSSKNTTPSNGIGSSKENNQKENTNKKSFTVSSTAYTANCAGCSGITTTGIDLKKNSNAKVIAVDPSVIPLGSLVHVEGYGYAIAGDTGSAIRGKKIDVFYSSKSKALNWGVRTVKVTIQ
ncbi:3D domain-containing protein [Oceanobacillus sp. FSL H7-0719]|uniref:PcsB-like coiled-coil domain-containing protein n=1 Tax=Oceanobacillus sp. FSL H7-0719 TaxID=2954507 RepID=UPI0032502D33